MRMRRVYSVAPSDADLATFSTRDIYFCASDAYEIVYARNDPAGNRVITRAVPWAHFNQGSNMLITAIEGLLGWAWLTAADEELFQLEWSMEFSSALTTGIPPEMFSPPIWNIPRRKDPMKFFYQVLAAGVTPPRRMAHWYATIRELTWDLRKGDAWTNKDPEDAWVIWCAENVELPAELVWKRVPVADLAILQLEEDMRGVTGMVTERLVESLKGFVGTIDHRPELEQVAKEVLSNLIPQLFPTPGDE